MSLRCSNRRVFERIVLRRLKDQPLKHWTRKQIGFTSGRSKKDRIFSIITPTQTRGKLEQIVDGLCGPEGQGGTLALILRHCGQQVVELIRAY